ncbi:hypothetical protein ASD24_24625 [Paenibacillus sp. Root52]|uniref:hypothetical protein n=1 Tax=Paenibacillus sp. Root52 TaxID=1736552 RepID=UPI0006FB4C31|nr:hypothetical protein [Paenibacillus sp. Root52]KQY90984.1 hypothetical protein ASD24_24625 [Paenibacillus sp. Root52]
MNVIDSEEILETLANWTQYGYIEGAHDIEVSYHQAVKHIRSVDEIDSISRTFPPLSEVLQQYRIRLQILEENGHRGSNMITGGEYFEIDLLKDMIANSPDPKIRY